MKCTNFAVMMKHLMTIIVALLTAASVNAQVNRLYIDDFEIYPDSTCIVDLILANESPTRGLQVNLTVPPGLRLLSSNLTEYTEELGMNLFGGNVNDSTKLIGMFPPSIMCLPADTIAIVTLKFYAYPEFTGGTVKLWKGMGSTIDNDPFTIDGDTTLVTVPQAYVPGVPMDQTPAKEQFFNLQGQSIDTPEAAPVAIQVTTHPNGPFTSRKVTTRR